MVRVLYPAKGSSAVVLDVGLPVVLVDDMLEISECGVIGAAALLGVAKDLGVAIGEQLFGDVALIE